MIESSDNESSDKIIVTCTCCGVKLRLPANRGMLEVKCPKCNNAFRVNSGEKKMSFFDNLPEKRDYHAEYIKEVASSLSVQIEGRVTHAAEDGKKDISLLLEYNDYEGNYSFCPKIWYDELETYVGGSKWSVPINVNHCKGVLFDEKACPVTLEELADITKKVLIELGSRKNKVSIVNLPVYDDKDHWYGGMTMQKKGFQKTLEVDLYW